MRRSMLCLLPALLAPGAWAAGPRTERVPGDVPSLIATPEGRATYDRQINGSPVPDRFGTALPSGLPAAWVEAMLRPSGDTSPLNTLGVRPLPGQPDLYAAILCTGGSPPTSPDDRKCTDDPNAGGGARLRVHLGLIEARAGAAPRLLAAPVAVDAAVDWRDTGLPAAPDALDDSPDGRIRPDSIDGFDPAPYRLSPGQPAFGIRAGWSYGYAGGFASYGALCLYALVDGRLRQVFAAPMTAFRDIAGDWRPDGSRAHDIADGANVLVVSGHATSGHFDLLLRNRNGQRQRLFRWDPARGAYRPAGS